jgi:aspartate racemase
VGGIGPASQIPLLEELLRQNVAATTDQQHIGYGLVNATSFPNRTEALNARARGNSADYDDTTRKIISLARFAKQEGFDSISFICNSIHAWRTDSDVQAALAELDLPWISLPGVAVEMIKQEHPGVTRVGVLGTDGTLQTGLYTEAITAAGLTPVNLELGSQQQNDVMTAAYNIKATGTTVSSEAVTRLTNSANYLVDELGAEIIIGGCTEVPLGLNATTYQREGITVIDPLVALAKFHLDRATNPDAKLPA